MTTMRDVRDAESKTGLKAVSTFSGCGGSSTGYRLAGFKVLWANEFIDEAARTYEANMSSETVLNRQDIRDVNAADILRDTGLSAGELDLFDGSPPCSAFSTAGMRHAGWGVSKSYSDGANQVVDDLFFEYARLLNDLQPKVFIAENVTGLVKGSAKGYFQMIIRELKRCGYKVKAYVVKAEHCGVPQERHRLIFIGVRNDIGVTPTPPKPRRRAKTIKDVFPYVVGAGVGGLGVGSPFSNNYSAKQGMRPASRPFATLGASIDNFPTGYSPAGFIATDRLLDPHIDGIDPETGKDLTVKPTSNRHKGKLDRASARSALM